MEHFSGVSKEYILGLTSSELDYSYDEEEEEEEYYPSDDDEGYEFALEDDQNSKNQTSASCYSRTPHQLSNEEYCKTHNSYSKLPGDDDDYFDLEILHDEENCFRQQYRCFPHPHIEQGNRITMPASAFDRLPSIDIEYPMLFEIKNPYTGRVSHCGILEFTAEEGFALLPDWMMKSMDRHEGQLLNLQSTALPKGEFMKIQPHSREFLGISDPKSVLEAALRGFACLTAGDTIMIAHGREEYFIDVLETKPFSAISVVDTDCEVDFAPPLDYKEPEKEEPRFVINPKMEVDSGKEETKFRAFSGVSRRLDGGSSDSNSERWCLIVRVEISYRSNQRGSRESM